MKLDRLTVCQLFKIGKPQWNGKKQRTVGLNVHKIGWHNEIHIGYKDKDGEPLYPFPYYISREQAEKYPIQKLKDKEVYLRIIPIDDLERLERV